MTISDRTTRTPSGRAKRQRRKVSVGMLLMLGLFAGFLGLAPSAGAHHPEMTATGVCSNGLPAIDYTATSWSTGNPGSHPSISVQYRLNPADPWTTIETNNFQPGHLSFSGTKTFPAGTTTVYTRVVASSAKWGDWYDGTPYNLYSQGGGESFGGPTITLPTNCTPPSTPSAIASVVCASNKITVTFTGVGSATTVDITKNGNPVAGGDDVNVPVGASTFDVPLVAGDENTTVAIGLNYAAAAATDQNLQVPVNCKTPPAPGGAINWACGEQVSIALTNTGDEAIDASIYRNDVFVKTVSVPKGGLNTTIAPTGENTTMTIKVTFADAGTGTDLTKQFTVDCDKPAPTIAQPVCQANGGLDVTLGNAQGTDTASFTIVLNGNQSITNVLAGGTTVVNIPVAEDATVSLSITSGAVNYTNAALTRDCQKPAATVVFSCATGGVLVSLTNSGSEAALVNVNGEQVNVPAGTTAGNPVTRTIAVAEDAPYNVTVLGQTAQGTRDCEKPAATVVFECAEGGVVVTLTNTGVLPTTVQVNGNPVNVPAGGSPVIVKIPVAEGASYNITVLGQTAQGTRDCEKPVASVAFSCAAGGVVVKLSNSGELPIVVPVNGEQVNVPAGTTAENPVTRTIPVAEGAAYDVTVLGQNASGTRDCEKPAATVVFECAEGGVVVTLTNTGELPTTVQVNGNPVNVPAGGSPVIVKIPVAEGEAYNITVLGQNASGTRDCEKPTVKSISLECAEGGVVVVLGNDGENDAEATVNGETVTIPAGGTKKVIVPVAENSTYDFDVVVDGDVTEVKGLRDCEQPGIASVTLECAEGGVVVSLTNTGESDTDVTVNGAIVSVPANGSKSVVVAVEENAAYDFTVQGDGIDEQFTGTRDCEQPAIKSVQLECAEGGVLVTLGNDGDADTTVLVDGVEVLVPAGSTAQHLVPVDENAAYDFTVVGDGLDQRVTGTLDCLLPDPTVDDEVVCAAGGLNVVLRNTGDDTAEYTITSPALPGGATIESVEAGDVVSVLIPLAEDATTSVKVTALDEVLLDTTITRDCDTVQGNVVTPGALPRTGANTLPLLALAGALLLAGAALVTGSRRTIEA